MNSDKEAIPLSKLSEGRRGLVKSIASAQIQRILGELGICPGSELTCVLRAPFHGPAAFQCGDLRFALRHDDCLHILVEPFA